MTVHFASDHAGFEMKGALAIFVRDELGLHVKDHGASVLDERDDYPDFVMSAAKAVVNSNYDRTIILGGSGQGEAMAANRIEGVRAAVYYGGPAEIVTLSRQHNDANVLSLGARFLSLEEAKAVVKAWLSTDFSGDERHRRRLAKLDSGKTDLVEKILGAIMK